MTSTTTFGADIHQVLRDQFGFEELRPGQQAVIDNVLAGRDTLAIMPTGSGKSLTYQLSAALLPGLTIVISPLIALMKDQVESLPPMLQRQTRLINSTLTSDEMDEALRSLRSGELKLAYVAPERLRDRNFLRSLASADVSMVVIDEAHCISLWGQDFRPDYLFIPKAIETIGTPTVLAVTATATPAMAKQISEGLDRQLAIERVSLFRPNLFYSVHHLQNREAKIEEMIRLCKAEQGSGIVYVNSRGDTERFAGLLRDRGVDAIHYHAGLEPGARSDAQDRFMTGRTRVVVATIAFGMGVDKANVRFIIHFNPPTSLEAYAQESGRAGRDDEPARCMLFATQSDKSRLRSFANRDRLSIETLRSIYRGLRQRATGRWVLLQREVVEVRGGESVDSRIGLGLLEQAGLIARHADVPRTIRLIPHGDSRGSHDTEIYRIISATGSESYGSDVVIDVPVVCDELGITPVDLDQTISLQQKWRTVDGRRATCIEMLPATTGSSTSVDSILATIAAESDRRIDAMLGYARSTECRHVVLARQFGEQIDPCGNSCDNCREPGRKSEPQTDTSETKNEMTVVDVAAMLETVEKLPYPMGKTGLVRYLTGSPESRVRKDRAPNFGILADMRKSVVDRAVDRLVEENLLFRDFDHEYKIITLTESGKFPDRSVLESIATRVSSGRRSAKPDIELGAEDRLLYDRLVHWRSETAASDSVPAYVIAHNSMLASTSLIKPTTLAELLDVQGFGEKKVATHGNEIIAIVQSFLDEQID